MKRKIAIIGGGAAGFMSAVVCAERGAEALIIEKRDRVLKKVLATGNGRCNFTNIFAEADHYYGREPDFIRHAFDRFPPAAALSFFARIGVPHKVEENGKVYPLSGQAAAVVDALRFRAEALGVKIINDFDAIKISGNKNGFQIQAKDGASLFADKVVLATGGKAAPDLGGDGGGYALAAALGHTCTPLRPALVQLKTEKESVKGLQGIKVDADVRVYHQGKLLRRERNEVLFTEYGISGSAVFDLSYLAALYDPVVFCLDFMPDYDHAELTALFKERRATLSYLTTEHFLNGVLHKKLGQALIKKSGVEKLSLPVPALPDAVIEKLAALIKNYDIKITGTTGFKNAQVTAGGLATADFDGRTMASKKVPGLYAAGEILDIFGDCGGYNLHWAWASGYLAGVGAAGEETTC